MKAPDFFLVGAPKSGTTSLARYLGEHPEIFFSSPKEPYFWCDDFPRLREFHNMESKEQYLRLFANAGEQHLAVGEGSTNYLYSQTAVSNILADRPDARFLVMLRNPVEVVYAMHGTLLYAMNEDVRDFERAWELQSLRREGQHIPRTCLAPQFLQYRELASFGRQMDRFLRIVPASQRHIVLFDDFVSDIRGSYADVLEFLGVRDDGRSEFPVENASKRLRFRVIQRLIRRPPPWLERPMHPLRQFLMSQKKGAIASVLGRFRMEANRPPLRQEFADHLQDEFREEVAMLGELLHRDLTHWTVRSSKPRRSAVQSSANGLTV
ncbi:MAG: sulfotransferase [Planctomycetaceae bacterium]|nr:sulfotransferase [Planctomycetaceae bacterium]